MAARQASAPRAKASDFDDAPARDARVFLIDGSSLAYRSFFALPQEIATAEGFPTGGLLGFSNMLVKLVGEYDPAFVAVAWDLPGETVRSRTFADYKAHRPPMPDALQQQWPHFAEFAEAFGFTNVSHDEYEADDVIGTLATRAAAAGHRTCIVTGDRDALQLVSDDVVVMMTTRGVSEVAVYTPERVRLRYGIAPQQVADLIALRGDTSDNIPGVPGIGEKTAADLLTRFSSLERVLDSIDDISGEKRKQNLRENADLARISKDLATIVCDLPLTESFDDLTVRPVDRARVAQLCQQFEFRSLRRRVEELDADPQRAARGDDSPLPSSVAKVPVAVRRVGAPEISRAVQAANDAQAPVAVNVSADGDAFTVAVATGDGSEALVATGTRRPLTEAIDGATVISFEGRKALAALGVVRCTIADDVHLAAWLLDPSRRTLLLGDVLDDCDLQPDIAGEDAESDDVILAARTALLPRLASQVREQLAARGMLDLYTNIELPLIPVLQRMERHGVRVDTWRMGEINARIVDQLAELVDRAHGLAGHEFNLGSPQQLGIVLFEELGLPAGRKGKTGYSTDARVLRDLRDLHPIVPVIEQWRELSKLKNTYLDTLPDLISPEDGRLHTTFLQTGAATGRLASINPNLQNIPVRTPVGREIRSAFVPAEGCRFVSCDYSQVELRLLAHVSQEPRLLEVFARGEDIHRATAAEVAGVDLSEVTDEQRSAAKAINFGIIYGISSFGLSSQLQISRDEAKQYIERYLGRYPYVSEFIERTIENAKRDGYVTTLLGRRRQVPELRSRSYSVRQLGERLAVNTVLQGSAADIMKIAMINVDQALAESGTAARMVLQIHDELLLEVPSAEVGEISSLVRRLMADAYETTPPLVVHSGSGDTWLDAK